MKNNTIKFLIYDILGLINAGVQESCTEIEKRLDSGEIVEYLLQKYEMRHVRLMNCQEATDLLKENRGAFTNEVYKEENGLLFLIEALLEY